MKVLINAISIKEGGGAVFFIKTFNEMLCQEKNIQWFVIIDGALRDQLKKNSQVTFFIFPWIKKSAFHFLYWQEIIFPRLVKKIKIDCVFSLINTLPIRKLLCPTFLCILQAGYFSEEFEKLNFKYHSSFHHKIAWEMRKYWTFFSIRKATKVTTPTQALADEILSKLNINKNKIMVILPGTGVATGKILPKQPIPEKTWRIGYITKYGVQKNFEVLFQAVAKLKKTKINFQLILTLDENLTEFQFVKPFIKQYNIADLIENHGESTEEQLRNLYLTLDLFVFPSLCESIGFTLLEAMHYGLPVIAANTTSNRELLGERGLFFSPHHDNELFHQILSIVNDQSLYFRLSEYSIQQSQTLSWEKTAQNTLVALKGLTCVTN